MDAQQIGMIIGTIILVIITGVVSFITGNKKQIIENGEPYITQKDLSDCKIKIYEDVDEKIEKATKELATKESVSHLSEGFEKLEKKFEAKMDEFTKTLTDAIVNIAILADRRNKPRD